MTYTKTFSFAIASLLLAAGCPASDDGAGDGGSDTGSTGATAGDTAPSTMSSTTAPADDDGMDASASGDDADDTTGTPQPTTGDPTTGDPTTGDPTSGGSTGGGSSGDGSSGGGMGGVCDPDGDDDECATCVKTNCCTQLEACAEDAGCTCFQDCVEMNPGVAGAIACGGDCNVMIFGSGPTAELVMCSSAPPCATPCGV